MIAASQLAEALRSGDRRALAKAITLVESNRADERELAEQLLATISSAQARSFRVGVTGVPGAGKSTLIDVLGCHALAAGARVAVLAVDPSSRQSGGSVLGDKTRMTRLSAEPAAFIRPSPSLGVLGGTAGRTQDVILLCEAAGYDLVFVETVGVGQAEERVADMVDCVLLVLLAGAGDEVSSMKRGVLEAADVIAFNKAEGERAPAAHADAASLQASLTISRGARVPPVLVLSALADSGVDQLFAVLTNFEAAARADGSFELRRRLQRQAGFDSALEQGLRDLFTHRADLALARAAAADSVANGSVSASEAVRALLTELLPVVRR